jgi:enoyl-CoA hydratase
MPRDYSAYLENLRVDVKDRILTLQLHNPDKLNANTRPMHYAMSRIWDEIDDDDDVDLIILTGAGDRAFSAGGDPREMQVLVNTPSLWRQTSREARRMIRRILGCDKPIISRINGHAIGLGASIALCGDITVMVEDARFGDPHVAVGLVAGDGGALLWPQLAGWPRAKEMLFTGEIISGKQAAEMGVINHAVPREQLDAKVDEIAQKILANAPMALRLTKNAMNLQLRQIALPTMELSLSNELISAFSDDHMEATTAMIEKRKPQFRGE